MTSPSSFAGHVVERGGLGSNNATGAPTKDSIIGALASFGRKPNNVGKSQILTKLDTGYKLDLRDGYVIPAWTSYLVT